MEENEKTLNYDFLSVENLINFVTKFTKIDSNALLEIRDDGRIVIKSFTASRTAVKVASIPMSSVFEDDGQELKDSVLIGIYNLEKLIKLLSYVDTNSDASLKVTYQQEVDGSYYAKNILIKTKIFNKEFVCANKSLFKHMNDEVAKEVLDVENNYFNLELDQSTLKMIKNISALEPSDELSFCAYKKDGEDYIEFKGKTYKIPHYGESEVNEYINKAAISKEYLQYTDDEDYMCYITDQSIILISKDTDTKLALGRLPDEVEEYTDDEVNEETEEILDEID